MFHMYFFEKYFDKLFWSLWNVIVHTYIIFLCKFCMIVQHLWFWVISNLWRTSDMGRLTLTGNNFAKFRETSNCRRYHCSEELNIYKRIASSTCYHIIFEWNHRAKEVKSPAHRSFTIWKYFHICSEIMFAHKCSVGNHRLLLSSAAKHYDSLTQPMISSKPGKIVQFYLNGPLWLAPSIIFNKTKNATDISSQL